MASDLEIVNAALLDIGAEKIATYNEDSDKADTCRVKYEQLRDNALATTNWRFATKKIQLSQLVAAPVNEWTYKYDLPPDRLAAPHAVFNSDQVGADPTAYGWEIFDGDLYTDYELIIVDYRYDPGEGAYPPAFVFFLVKALAAELAMPIMENATRANDLYQIAWGPPGEGNRGGLYAVAAQTDAAGNVANRIIDYSLVSARFGR